MPNVCSVFYWTFHLFCVMIHHIITQKKKGIITMYSFTNDYSEGAHPRILNAMMETNLVQHDGYGLDHDHCEKAAQLIRNEICQADADIHFLVGGTQTNLIAIAAVLKPWQAVISATTGHINVHETGAVEATGHKVLARHTPDGKLTPAIVEKALKSHTDEHMVQPKMVYISNTTEIGTQYTKAELEALSHFCRQNDLYLFLDGARLGAALTSPVNDLTMADIASLVDLFYIGGTKNGALLGEALVVLNPAIKPDFRYMIKQRGAMLAKGWLLGIQFEELFTDGLFYQMAEHANRMAGLLRTGIEELGFPFYSHSMSNQLFPIFPDKLIQNLSSEFQFLEQAQVDEAHHAVRLVTSWATKESEVSRFLELLRQLS